MPDKVDENPSDDVKNETPAEDVLDQVPDVQGDLVENPTIEEEVEDADTSDDNTDEEASDTGDAATESDGDESAGTGDTGEETGTPAKEVPEPTAELEAEADETGVYEAPPVDPGEFQPKTDYAFEITTTDGKTHKIISQDEADRFANQIDDDPSSISASQFSKFTQGMTRMTVGLERERSDWEANKEQYDTQQAQVETRNNQITQWNNEVNYLRSKGLLPEITAEQNASNWIDPKNAEVPAIKETLAIFNWMQQENQSRRAAGIAEVTSAVDAFTMMQAEQKDTQAADERTTERTVRQAKGSMVGGNAPHTPSSMPKNTIIGEGGSLQDLVYEASNSL